MPGYLIRRFLDDTVVKIGRRVMLDERPTLDLAACLKLPVPHVHESQSLDGEAWIRMSFVPGERLDVFWPSMTVEEKDSICGAVRDCRQYSDYSNGPYPDEAKFSLFYLDLVKSVPDPILFSHGDFAQHNILVKDGAVTGLLDWEYAGWYPEYWECIEFSERPCKHKDWKIRAKEIFSQCYDNELTHHQAIVHWQRP
ncbi:hypothetical protein K458DRAFT_442677 [Lentithecium fluviatile CBS 122367]|uniref:Aminoglycoside phosphotransferase domain-containing protein n=1 Tax=Lentithecium fluviatile CBS 122367 TaxID=1168545 RepID=A0A6G1J416_9PLEO|nr:hypothetical protein K458DRAFT_442677 [Lentithecium fluviatile CBS 122367]